MDAKIYQELAARTLILSPDFQITEEQVMLVWNVLGLAGEAGEIVELVKKGIFHQKGLDETALRKELGDVLWYVAAVCTKLGLDMGEIMQENIEKLRVRYPYGYNPTHSLQRMDVDGEKNNGTNK